MAVQVMCCPRFFERSSTASNSSKLEFSTLQKNSYMARSEVFVVRMNYFELCDNEDLASLSIMFLTRCKQITFYCLCSLERVGLLLPVSAARGARLSELNVMCLPSGAQYRHQPG
jgi:hypothetical protein